MKKVLARYLMLIAVPVLIVTMLFGTSAVTSKTAKADTNRPLVTCSPCVGSGNWTGATVYGGLTTVYVPSYTGSSTNVLERFIFFSSNSGDTMEVGYCFGNNTADDAACTSNSGVYFVEECISGACTVQKSIAIPSGDEGGSVQFGMQADSTTSADYDLIINDEPGGHDQCTFDGFTGTHCAFTTQDASYNQITIYNENWNTFTGTNQGTFEYIFNQWVGSGLGFSDQASSPTTSGQDGAEMYTLHAPNGETNEGGDIQGCNIDDGDGNDC